MFKALGERLRVQGPGFILVWYPVTGRLMANGAGDAFTIIPAAGGLPYIHHVVMVTAKPVAVHRSGGLGIAQGDFEVSDQRILQFSGNLPHVGALAVKPFTDAGIKVFSLF